MARGRTPTASSTAGALAELDRLKADFGAGRAARKRVVLEALERASLPRAADVAKLHEALCFMRAYPDDAPTLRAVRRMLAGFASREDLKRHRDALVDSGIAGTDTYFRFFQPMADWLARRFPDRLHIDWDDFKRQDKLERLLSLLALYAETPGLDEFDFGVRAWIKRLKGPGETDATFLVRRFAQLSMDPFARELLYDDLDPPMILKAGADTPTRTLAWHPVPAIAWQQRALRRARPDLRAGIGRRPRRIRVVPPREAEKLIDLSRGCMVNRQRDLDVFSHGDPHDVRMIEYEDGLQFACIGAVPERRLLLEAVYGFLTLKNGVPMGYVLSSALFNSAEIAYNVFETFRGGEAALVYARVLAMVRHLFGADSFTIYPYQLGHENAEALQSGAWWFYQKLGFAPRDAATVKLMGAELARMKKNPAHRSSIATLARLSRENVYFHVDRRRDDVIGLLPLANVGLNATTYLAKRFGSDRAGAEAACAREAAELLGVVDLDRLPAGERLAWNRWAPIVVGLPGVARWPAKDRRALVDVVRAKGGRREEDFVRKFDAHTRLRRAIRALATAGA